ncbi:ankyrin repeat domain-containing protein [Mycolicibacterium sp. J2]|uniref:ankyrin repeat domain-containing protein n=1 Tax=Mycolicibacterium sp. J2 TaxID=2993511 RepID=UPI00224B18FC|nr:ankyrin repeat domain-containing protein [Mycolicibacterium sp. J2]MCX2716049.1 ankyrin repeat domain-containing protein [Mycolicibacterium sp. J2]
MARTPLHQAAVRGTQDSVRVTIGEGYDVNEPDADGLTPLHMAAINNNYGAAKILLEAGADVDPQDKWGNTPLNRAVFEEDTHDLVRLLVDCGSNPTLENYHGHSPLSEAERYRKADCLSMFKNAT